MAPRETPRITRTGGAATRPPHDRRALLAVKVVHTAVWVFFVACIVAIPVATWHGRFGLGAVFAGIVFLEVAVLAANRWSCPLTPIAARYTDDRRANFDIYLPEWIARHNVNLFGALYLGGVAYLLLGWLTG